MRPASCAARVDGRARHQPLDALVGVAQPLFQPHHGLAAGGEAEMSRLDDSGMHGTDRDLVQAVAFGRQKAIGRSRPAAAALRSPSGCCTSQKPRSSQGRVSGAPSGVEAKQIVDGALQPDRWRVEPADRRKASIRAVQADHRDFAVGFIHDRHMHRRSAARSPQRPSSSSGPRRVRSRRARQASGRHDQARPWPMALDALALRDDIE